MAYSLQTNGGIESPLELTTYVRSSCIGLTNELRVGWLDGQRRAVAIDQAHVATIADEMDQRVAVGPKALVVVP